MKRISHRLRAAALLTTVIALGSIGVSGSAVAADPPPVTDATQAAKIIPGNSQMGRLRLPYSCDFPILGEQTLGLDLQGTFTTLLAPGQQYWFSDGRAKIEVPGNLATLLSAIGVATVDATVSNFTINAVNATPAGLNALPNGLDLKGIPVVSGQKTVIPIDGPLKVGPFTAGSSGLAALKMGGAVARITLKAKDGGTILIPLEVKCAAPSPDVVLAGINIGKASDATDGAPSNQGLYGYPNVDLEHQQGSGKVPLICQFPAPLNDQTTILTFTGDAGTVYGVGEKFYLKDASAYLEVPPDVAGKLVAQYPGTASVQLDVSKFNIDSAGATPANLNVAAAGWKLPAVPVTAGKPVGLRFPGASGFITAGPFTAGAPGVMRLEVGDAAGTVNFLNAAGGKLGSLSITCAKRNPAVTIVPLVSSKPTQGTPSVAGLGSGSVKGGEYVTLAGLNLEQVREVYFGDVAAPYVSAVTGFATTVETPPHAPGKVKVTVRTLSGTATSDYTYK